MDWLVQTHYPDAPKIKLVQDNYATHSYGAFYEHLPLDTARDLRHRLEFHFTPKHGSWLNMAEIEFSALFRQCLDRRIGTQQRLEEEALCWQTKRNAAAVKVNWSFTTEKARDKLKNRCAELSKKLTKLSWQTTRSYTNSETALILSVAKQPVYKRQKGPPGYPAGLFLSGSNFR